MNKKKKILVAFFIVALFGAIFVCYEWRGRAAPKENLSEIFAGQLLSGVPLDNDQAIKLETIPFGVNKYQATEIKKYRFGKLLLLRVGRASNGFAYQAPILEQADNNTLPSGVFASSDGGKNWTEIIASDSVLARNMLFRGLWRLEPSGIFLKDKKMYADFFVGDEEGPLLRLTTTDGMNWKEYGCYMLIPEKYDQPFSLDPTVRCLTTTAQLDNWMPPMQKPTFEVDKARETLLAYLGALSMGWYEEAAAMYGGKDLDILRDWNPDTSATDIPALLDASCHRQTVCTFPITVMPAKNDPKNGLYYFDVVLPIGDFDHPMNRKFTYIVKSDADGKYTVETLPAYVQ